MPIYHFEHAISLSQAQKLALVKAITDWHATTFRAPRFIVNVRFVNVSSGLLSDTYVGGAPRQINRLFVALRSGAGRTPAQLEGIADKLEGFWNDTVGSGTIEKKLRGVFIQGTIDSAKEAGFHLPLAFGQPGHFEQWVKDNRGKFQELADGGDPDAAQVIGEIQTRKEFQD